MWDENDEDRVKMEIMLGMAQEEGPPCLLCLLPRCICHLTLEIAKIDCKLTQLRTLEPGKEKVEEQEHSAEGSLGGLLEGGGLTHTEGELKSSREGSSPPRSLRGSWKLWKMRSL